MDKLTTTTTPEYRQNLWQLDERIDALATVFDQLADDPTFEDAAKDAVLEYFGQAIEDRDAKLDRYAAFIDYVTVLAKARKAESDRLSALATIGENTAKRLKGFLKMWLESKGLKKIETPMRKFWTQNNGGLRPIIVDKTDPMTVDPCYRKVTVEFDNDAIRADLEAGIEVPFARFGEVGSHLRVK